MTEKMLEDFHDDEIYRDRDGQIWITLKDAESMTRVLIDIIEALSKDKIKESYEESE